MAPTCELDGSYRLRYHSNGVDGWWLRLAVTGKTVKLSGTLNMLGLEEAAPLEATPDPTACTLTLAKTTKQAGDLKIVLQVAGGKVTGTVARTANGDKDLDTSPITGVRETAPEKVPDCIKPGIYTIGIEHVKTWKTEGSPRFGNTCDKAGFVEPHVRVEVLDGKLMIDETEGQEPYAGSFGRGTVERSGDCEATIALEVQDFKLVKSKVTFAGDKFTGKTTDFTYEVFEDGTAGENQWSCATTDGDVVGKRVAD